MGGTIAERLADYGVSLMFEHLSREAVHEAKRRVIDALGCALGAYGAPPVNIARLTAPVLKEGLASTIIGGGWTVPDSAAFVNGVMVRYLDYNDTYLSKEPAHPSDNIAPAIAACEAAGKGGKDLITAIVAAYEVQCRLCDAASLRARGWDHVAYGAFSSTLAASRLFGLTKEQTVHALGIAGTTSVALRQTRAGELSMWKGCAFANTARQAVFSAMLASNGMTGPAPVFEGEFGFLKLVTGPFELPSFAGKDNPSYKILDTYMKYFPVEYHAQSAVGAAVELASEIEDPDMIESVTVSTFGAGYEIIGSGAERWRPKTRETADHSLAYCVASALMDGTVTLETFSDERLRNEELLGLVARVKVVKDAELDRLYPEAIPNRVEAVLKDGKRIAREIIYPKGHPKNPLTDIEVEEKFKRLSQWYYTDTEMHDVLEALWRLDEIKGMGELFKFFSR